MSSDASGKRSLEAALFDSLRSRLTSYGFTFNAKKNTFLRPHEGVVDQFQIVCLDASPGLRIQPNVGVRFDRVENIFHQTSGFDRKYQADTPSIGGTIGSIYKGDTFACGCIIEKPPDISESTEYIMRLFQDFALAYFDRFSSLAAIDAELNDHPTQPTHNRPAAWLRCSTGVIVAKLVGRPNLTELIDVYTDVMTRMDKGFYLKRFESLVRSLQTLSPEVPSAS
jgi:hypothetical protein